LKQQADSDQRAQRVVVVGGGFAGVAAVKALRDAPVEVTLVDRRNFHLFQPLLYQVATGALSPGEIASPLRAIFRRQANAEVLMAEVTDIDLQNRRVLVQRQADGQSAGELAYDWLVVACGASHSYFGHDEWERYAPGLKGVDDALEIRKRVLQAFEAAELERDLERRAAWLTFVVVGAGPTGVELSGQIAEIARDTLKHDFRTIDPSQAQILLVEAADGVLTSFDRRLSAKAESQLKKLGVTPRLGTSVVDIGPGSVTIVAGSNQSQLINTHTIVWAAGNKASPLTATLARASGSQLDRADRITVLPDLTLPGHAEAFAVGDMARVADDGGVQPLPGTAPPAMQEGRYVASAIKARLDGEHMGPFTYTDKGNLATIGRRSAVAEIKGLRFSDTTAWLVWLFVHLLFLVGLENRAIVFLRWVVSFFTRGRGARLITRQ
jgi:NADH:ubiquinone reductase (H+-translocating)